MPSRITVPALITASPLGLRAAADELLTITPIPCPRPPRTVWPLPPTKPAATWAVAWPYRSSAPTAAPLPSCAALCSDPTPSKSPSARRTGVHCQHLPRRHQCTRRARIHAGHAGSIADRWGTADTGRMAALWGGRGVWRTCKSTRPGPIIGRDGIFLSIMDIWLITPLLTEILTGLLLL